MNKELPVAHDPCCTPVQPSLGQRDADESASLFAALGDPTRLTIVHMLARSEDAVCVCDITAGFALSQPTISHHLKILRDVGLISGEKRGKWVYYALVPGKATAIHAVLDSILRVPVPA